MHIIRSLKLRKLAEQCIISPKSKSKLKIAICPWIKITFFVPGDNSGAQDILKCVPGRHLQEKPP
jgi:hypothetical protein